jgi:hypothetical protein
MDIGVLQRFYLHLQDLRCILLFLITGEMTHLEFLRQDIIGSRKNDKTMNEEFITLTKEKSFRSK